MRFGGGAASSTLDAILRRSVMVEWWRIKRREARWVGGIIATKIHRVDAHIKYTKIHEINK